MVQTTAVCPSKGSSNGYFNGYWCNLKVINKKNWNLKSNVVVSLACVADCFAGARDSEFSSGEAASESSPYRPLRWNV